MVVYPRLVRINLFRKKTSSKEAQKLGWFYKNLVTGYQHLYHFLVCLHMSTTSIFLGNFAKANSASQEF